MDTEQTKFSILMFPWLAYSHVFPFLELAKTLSKSNFHIYFCSSAINLDLIKNSLHKGSSHDASIELVELQLPSSPELPPNFHTTKNLPSNLLPNLLQTFQLSSSSFSEILITLKPDLLIYDFFQPWAPKLASSQGIPSIYFATSGAAPFSYFHHHHTNGTFSTYPYQEIYLLDHEKAALGKVIPPKIKDSDDEEFGFGVFKLSYEIVLIKSLRGIEGKYINYLSKLCHKRVISTGPLVQDSDSNEESCSDILEWLSKKDQLSTVFICFGSEHFLSKEQMQEFAKGLELCDVNFVWIVRFPVEEKTLCKEDVLPSGFLERVKERGFVMQGWAPQAEILSHSSIGGFLSHCGWSSIMESLYLGVPVIALPIKFDQPINARLVVNAGVGVEVGKDENGHFSGEEVAKAINYVILDKTAEVMRDRTRDFSQEMRREEEKSVREVSEQLLELCIKSKEQFLLPVSSSGN